MNTKRSLKPRLVALACATWAAILAPLPGHAQEIPKGLVIFVGTPGLGQEVARALECAEIEEFPMVVNVRPLGGGKQRLMRGQILAIHTYPDFAGNITSEEQVAAIRAKSEILTGMISKCPQAKSTLEVAKERFDFALRQWESGKILLAGKWCAKPSAGLPSVSSDSLSMAELTTTNSAEDPMLREIQLALVAVFIP